jgi:hypothetical protein
MSLGVIRDIYNATQVSRMHSTTAWLGSNSESVRHHALGSGDVPGHIAAANDREHRLPLQRNCVTSPLGYRTPCKSPPITRPHLRSASQAALHLRAPMRLLQMLRLLSHVWPDVGLPQCFRRMACKAVRDLGAVAKPRAHPGESRLVSQRRLLRRSAPPGPAGDDPAHAHTHLHTHTLHPARHSFRFLRTGVPLVGWARTC